jgi:hypothetical protein
LVDASIYLGRNVRWTRNPVPKDWGVDKETQWKRPRPDDDPWRRMAGLTKRRD